MCGRPLYEGVDWNPHLTLCQYEQLVALFTRAWIEIFFLLLSDQFQHVALFTRAWIEISFVKLRRLVDFRRPLYEGVDWNTFFKIFSQNKKSPSLRGRGLKWLHQRLVPPCIRSRPLYEGVDWNLTLPSPLHRGHVALFTRAWIEIERDRKILKLRLVALFTRAWIEINIGQRTAKRESSRPLYEGVDWNNGLYCL